MTDERTIGTTTHGRYLVDIGNESAACPLLVGFHGYAEHAPLQLGRLRAVRGSSNWNLAAIQGLHRFYRAGAGGEIAASWMTREDRELTIADNILYVDSVIDALASEFNEPTTLVYAGFSQGAGMAYRAAVLCARRPSGVITLGGDIPPELPAETLARIPHALVGRGVRDRFYSAEKRDDDVRRLASAGVRVEVVDVDAGHEWTEAFTHACAGWLHQIA